MTAQPPPRHAIVIGSGLGGACAAAELRLHGWAVTLLHAPQAAAATDLPVGLMAPLVTAADTASSQLVRAGQAVTLDWAQRLLVAGRDWAPVGCRECNPPPPDAAPRPRRHKALPPPPAAGADWTQPVPQADALWHPRAAWLRPRALADALLRHAGVLPQSAAVAGLRQVGGLAAPSWQVLGRDGGVLAQAPVVLVAAGTASTKVLATANPDVAALVAAWKLARTPGQISWASGSSPPGLVHALNGHGHLIPNVPWPETLQPFGAPAPCLSAQAATFFGASYRHDDADDPPHPRAAEAHANRQRAMELCEAAGHPWQAPPAGELQHWAGSRCTSPDRLPRVGALGSHAPGLWALTGLGSRGLSLAPLAARCVATQLSEHTSPIEPALVIAWAAQRLSK